MRAQIDQLHDFCNEELNRRRAGLVASEIADAVNAVRNVLELRTRIVEKDVPPDDFWHVATHTAEDLAIFEELRPGKALPPKDGEPYLLLVNRDATAAFFAIERSPGIQCYFLNRGDFQGPFWGSVLIRQAQDIVWTVFPYRRLYTFFHSREPGREKFPGLAWRMAGWAVINPSSTGVVKLGANPKWFRGRPAGDSAPEVNV